MEFMFVVYVFCSLYGEISELYYKRAGEAKARFHLIGYFSKFWNYIDILRIVMFFGCIGGCVQWGAYSCHFSIPDPTAGSLGTRYIFQSL